MVFINLGYTNDDDSAAELLHLKFKFCLKKRNSKFLIEFCNSN